MTSRSESPSRPIFPFAALVGQEAMKLALLLSAVQPAIGGVLIRGEKGTAKSTAARGLAVLLPDLEDAADGGDPPTLRAHGDPPDRRVPRDAPGLAIRRPPFVELPLGATEDCVVGSIDLEAAIRLGEPRFRPGLLSRAHRGVLYVDEVNLLDDHLVDCLLDATESGINRVEREGLSVEHPARFQLIGTMNPEEGELRPQLLDRFGLAVEVKSETDLAQRVELLRRRERFDSAPRHFAEAYADATMQLGEKLVRARKLVAKSVVSRQIRGFIAELCRRNHVAGHRADITLERAACAHAALKGRTQISSDDVVAVAQLVLAHRTRTGEPPELAPPPPQNNESQQEASEQPPDKSSGDESRTNGNTTSSESGAQEQREPLDPGDAGASSAQQDESSSNANTPASPAEPAANDRTQVLGVGQLFAVKTLLPHQNRQLRTGSGRRTRSRSASKQGRYVKSTPHRAHDDLALDATLRAAAPHQKHRRERISSALAVVIQEQDIREKIRERRIGSSLLFVVDASGSMGAQRRMTETKAAIMSLLTEAYQKRDKVGLIAFRQRDAEVMLDFTGSIERAARLLTELPVGGRTPLSAGLARTADILLRLFRREPAALPLVLILTDGKANVGFGDQKPHLEALALGERLAEHFSQTRFVVVDTEPAGAVRLQLAKRLATAMSADYFQTEDLRAEDLVQLARDHAY